ncbi:hypothetical protein LINPERPRIM_LOCUS37559 [Linum perenne]
MNDEKEGNPRLATWLPLYLSCSLSFQLEVVRELSSEQQLMIVELS